MPRKISYIEIKKCFAENNCELLWTEDDYNKLYKKTSTKISYIAVCKHNNTATFASFIKGQSRFCKLCSKRCNNLKYTYERIIKIFNEYNITLLLTKDEFKTKFGDVIKKENPHHKLPYKGTCGHIKETTLRIFERYGYNTKCKKCSDGCPTYEQVCKMLEDKNMKLYLSEEQFNNIYKNEDSIIPYIDTCGCKKTSKYYNLCKIYGLVCKICGKNNSRHSYEDIIDLMKSINCDLITTKEEFELLYKTAKDNIIKYTATCGHITISNYDSLLQGHNLKCFDCMCQNLREIGTIKQSGDNKLNLMKQELSVIEIFENVCKSEFNIMKAWDGCKTDIICNPKHIIYDKFIGLQIKTTSKLKNLESKKQTSYQFNGCNKYDGFDILMIFYCIEESITWMIPYRELKILNNNAEMIVLSLNEKNKYIKYLVKFDNIVHTLMMYYNNLTKYTYEFLNTPASTSQIQEKEFCINFNNNIREDFKIIRNKMEGEVYDGLIKNKKIQEKVMTTFEHKNYNSFSIQLSKNGGNQTKISYKTGDCDLYLLHSKCKTLFYLIPEQLLIENGYIDCDKPRYLTISPKINTWCEDFKFEYDNIDYELFELLFE